jgi:hypothetical protein
MTNPADNPCNCRACGALILNEVTSMCENCQDDMNAYYDEREDAERDRQMTLDNCCREADNQAFADACCQMTREDWDADNDWLASAGWGEM